MLPTTIDATRALLKTDPSLTPGERSRLLGLLRSHGKAEPERPQPINGRDAAAMLGVCRRTLERYERKGLLHAIRVSPRLIRFDAREVDALATHGVGA